MTQALLRNPRGKVQLRLRELQSQSAGGGGAVGPFLLQLAGGPFWPPSCSGFGGGLSCLPEWQLAGRGGDVDLAGKAEMPLHPGSKCPCSACGGGGEEIPSSFTPKVLLQGDGETPTPCLAEALEPHSQSV